MLNASFCCFKLINLEIKYFKNFSENVSCEKETTISCLFT